MTLLGCFCEVLIAINRSIVGQNLTLLYSSGGIPILRKLSDILEQDDTCPGCPSHIHAKQVLLYSPQQPFITSIVSRCSTVLCLTVYLIRRKENATANVNIVQPRNIFTVFVAWPRIITKQGSCSKFQTSYLVVQDQLFWARLAATNKTLEQNAFGKAVKAILHYSMVYPEDFGPGKLSLRLKIASPMTSGHVQNL